MQSGARLNFIFATCYLHNIEGEKNSETCNRFVTRSLSRRLRRTRESQHVPEQKLRHKISRERFVEERALGAKTRKINLFHPQFFKSPLSRLFYRRVKAVQLPRSGLSARVISRPTIRYRAPALIAFSRRSALHTHSWRVYWHVFFEDFLNFMYFLWDVAPTTAPSAASILTLFLRKKRTGVFLRLFSGRMVVWP